MYINVIRYPFLVFFFVLSSISAQYSNDTIVAEKGDGIFSILRKSGMDPVKYYEKFLLLNEGNIKNGSELIIGKKYILPLAPDSFKNMGIKISVGTLQEEPIFDKNRLMLMKAKDSSLKNTVYYLVNSGYGKDKNNFGDMVQHLSKDLLERGARVYVLQSDSLEENIERDSNGLTGKKTIYGEYSSIVNKKYIKHNGSYQRLLLFEDQLENEKNMTVSVHYFNESQQGEKLAKNLQKVIRKNALKSTAAKDGISSFDDGVRVFFAKNVLPPVITLDFKETSDPSEKGIKVKTDKKLLVNILKDGILQDHANLTFEK
ncbi:hypothetical protein J8L85_00860 [Maribacter sp. MMG018]|uniref:hypothetical protein n=1 Tax=Maribacter sp. MMG018 TaxID=2822688 RepID=UPI001B389193|nr:hypothetical protein [Maribacter sp. MMG018]MBQ4912965.1 hypothetical protein [Maribacter sp. MMG018]